MQNKINFIRKNIMLYFVRLGRIILDYIIKNDFVRKINYLRIYSVHYKLITVMLIILCEYLDKAFIRYNIIISIIIISIIVIIITHYIFCFKKFMK